MVNANSSGIDWSRVINDSGAGVMVVDNDGKICVINAGAAGVLAKRGPGEVQGMRLHEVLRQGAADERLDVSRRVIQNGRAVVFSELWNGVALRATVRRVEGIAGTHGPVAMWIYAPENETLSTGPDPDANTVPARHVDYGPLTSLTTSELRVLALIGEGLSNAEIAARLHRAVKTVESHRASLTEKTGSSSRVELGGMARRAGLIRRVDLPDAPPSSSAKATANYYG